MLTTTVLSAELARDDQVCLVFTHTNEQGETFGPYVEHRPLDEDQAVFLAAHAALLEQTWQEPVQPSEGE